VTDAQPPRDERWLVLLVGVVQLAVVLEFGLVAPLGPDLAASLGGSTSRLGGIGGAYTAAAALSGLLLADALERTARRRALTVALVGLSLAALATGAAQSLPALLLARAAAGVFGGPAGSLALAIVADAVPAARRGKAMGAVMRAFALASVVGVPAALETARAFGWRAPFLAVAALTLAVAFVARAKLPPSVAAAAPPGDAPGRGVLAMLRRPEVFVSYLLGAVAMLTGFLIVPNLAAFLLGNLGVPRGELAWLYLVGGTVSFFAMRWIGALSDRRGAVLVGSIGAALVVATVLLLFLASPPQGLLMALVAALMLAINCRNVPYTTLASQVPGPSERARFLSLQTTVQNVGAAIGAFLSSALLAETSEHALVGMETVALLACGLTLVMPLAMWFVARRVEALAPANVATLPERSDDRLSSPAPKPVARTHDDGTAA
jgi:predicted MFS family arabinose efflux permease